MKKFILTACVLLMGLSSFGACEEVVCPQPYELTSNVSRFLSVITGQKFLGELIGEKIIKKSVTKNLISGDIKTDLKSYSVRDLKAGRFKSIEINGKNVNAQGIYITSFNVKTLCDFNYIYEDKKGNVAFKEDLPLALSAEISEEDLNKTMASSDYQRLINDINSLGSNFNIFQITSTKVKLKNNKMYYVLNYSMPFMRKTKEVVLSANLHVKNGQIVLSNTTLENTSADIDMFSKLLNYMNPLDFSAKILENKDAKFSIQNVNITDGKITIDGRITVLKDKE